MIASSYYEYEFISPEGLFALIKEELKSYFDTGAVDDVLFPKWTDYCLKMLSKGTLSIEQVILKVEQYEAKLPANFHSVREAWGATCITESYQLPTYLYESVSTLITPIYDRCEGCDPTIPEMVNVTYKTDTTISHAFQVTSLLKPANLNAKSFCGANCLNVFSGCTDEFDVRNGKLITNFAEGDVYMVYYGYRYDENGNQLIPDNQRIQNYIEAYLKYKTFEMLCNQVIDETYNQIEGKRAQYQQAANEAYISALNEIKKETTHQKVHKMKRLAQRFKYYNIP